MRKTIKRPRQTGRNVKPVLIFIFDTVNPTEVGWADPAGTAIAGQPVEKPEQARDNSPLSKHKFNIESPQFGDVSDIKLIRTDTTL